MHKITRCFGKKEKEKEEELIKIICHKTKKEFEEKTEELKKEMHHASGKKRIEEGKKYLSNNWTAAKVRLLRKNGVLGSSTESHVSHILSERMSSRPKGWSKKRDVKDGRTVGVLLQSWRYVGTGKISEKESPYVGGKSRNHL